MTEEDNKTEEPVTGVNVAITTEDIPAPTPKNKVPNCATLAKRIRELTEVVDVLAAHVNDIQPTPTEPTQVAKDIPNKTLSGDSGILEVAREILGEGYKVSVEPAQPGISFKLKIVPPEHLKEHKDDVRVKVIYYIDGENGVKEYSLIVKNFCINWSKMNGVNYQVA